MFKLDLKNLFLMGVFCLNLFFGFIVYRKNKKNKTNLSFFCLVLSVAFWIISMVAYRGFYGIEAIIFLARILYLSAACIPIAFLYFTFIFPVADYILKGWQRFVLPIPFVCMAIISVWPDALIKGIYVSPDKENVIIFNFILHALYGLYIIGYFCWGYSNLIKKYFKASGVLRIQLAYIFIGTLVSTAIGVSTNLILPLFGIFTFNWLGQATVIIMIISIFYAILRFRLMNISVIIRKSSIFLFSAAAIIFFFFGILIFISNFAEEQLSVSAFFNIGFLLIIALAFYERISAFFTNLANKYFFASLYKKEQVFHQLIEKIPSVLDIHQLVDLISGTLVDLMKLEKLSIWYCDFEKEILKPLHNTGFNEIELFGFFKDKELQEQISQIKKPLLYREIVNIKSDENCDIQKAKIVKDAIRRIGIALYIPLIVKNKLIGIIIMGDKFGVEAYTKEDMDTLELLAKQTAVALENAKLYEETQTFGATLKKEVDKATTELKQANLELQRLDKTKSEFISIASHQLRTPLTAIKGFSSMILEGSYGKITKVLCDKIEKIYMSAERLLRLVNDLLDLSRMESGRMEFDFKKVNMGELVQSVIEELSQQAEKNKIKLEFLKPERDFCVWADEQKLRQVVMNLIDNAIKYNNEKGSVKISLKIEAGQVELSVKDTGLGINNEEINGLFHKFVRGIKAPRFHTEGTGVGLYIAKKLMDEHKGQIWAESAGEGKGSEFFIRLPEFKGDEKVGLPV